jgi:(p)ppGpp synthase/HD superfamily hydrolase
MHSYAKCCSPIPGDPIVGFVTTGEGVKIHRKNCKNIENLGVQEPHRIIMVDWPKTNGAEFTGAIRINGEDRPGLLNDVTHSISTFQNTNIRGVNIDTKDSLFQGLIVVNVKNTEHLQRILEKVRKVKGVSRAERFTD